MELTDTQRARLAGTLDAYMELRDRIPADTADDFEWHCRQRYEAVLSAVGHVLGILGVDAGDLLA